MFENVFWYIRSISLTQVLLDLTVSSLDTNSVRLKQRWQSSVIIR